MKRFKMDLRCAVICVLLQMTFAHSVPSQISSENSTLMDESMSDAIIKSPSENITLTNETIPSVISPTPLVNFTLTGEEMSGTTNQSQAINRTLTSEILSSATSQRPSENLTLADESMSGVISIIPLIGLNMSTESPLPTLTCDTKVVENLVKNANETCSQIDNVDKYIKNINSRQPFPISSFSDRHGFKEILNQYNSDLKKAQDNCHQWRDGDNIVDSLKTVVVTIQNFEPKFTEELIENQARVKNLLENHQDIAEVESKIAALQKDIQEAKATAELTLASTVLTHLENLIKSKEQVLNNTMKEHEVTQARRELAELTKYLGFVRNSSAEIEKKAETARSLVGTFRDSIQQDSSAFKRHRSNAQDGTRRIQEEKDNNNNEINANRQSITTLRNQIAQENNQIASLNAQIQTANNEIVAGQNRINHNMRKTKKKRKFGRWFRFVPVAGWIIGGKMYKDAKRKEEELMALNRNLINSHNAQIQNLHAHIASRNRDINVRQEKISSLEAKSRQLEEELQHFSQINVKLQSVENEVNSILPFVSNAFNGMSKMKDTFDSIKVNLEDVIRRANEATSKVEIMNMKYFIYNEIDKLKCKWDDARNKIHLVGQCG